MLAQTGPITARDIEELVLRLHSIQVRSRSAKTAEVQVLTAVTSAAGAVLMFGFQHQGRACAASLARQRAALA